jgi:hypothetical protein
MPRLGPMIYKQASHALFVTRPYTSTSSCIGHGHTELAGKVLNIYRRVDLLDALAYCTYDDKLYS